MADILTPDKRSQNMSAIKSRDTKPEIYFRKLLFAEGLRYRKNSPSIIGHPDIYLAKYHTAIFVHGCFWHRHAGCKYAYSPKTRVDFWNRKFEQNVQRDATVRKSLEEQGIKCLVIWECTIKNMRKDSVLQQSIIFSTLRFLADPTNMYLEL